MFTSLLMQDERRAGRAEGRIEGNLEGRKATILELLAEIGSVSDELETKIRNENDVDKLKAWARLVVKVDSISQFLEEM